MSSAATTYLKSSKRALILLEQPWLTTSHLKQIQSHLTVTGSIHDPFAAGRLITAFTSSCSSHNISYAYRLFLQSHHRTLYMWNSMIRAITESTQASNSLCLYKDMLGDGFSPNNYTFSFVIRACIDIPDLSMGLLIHTHVIRFGWESYDFVQNGLIHLYVICDLVSDARKIFDGSCSRDVVTWTALINGYVKSSQVQSARELFDRMPVRNSVSWSAMITGCVQSEQFEEALELFKEMQISGVLPTHAAIVGVLTASAFLGALEQGKWIHAYVQRNNVELDTKLGTALVDMYAKCGCIETAQQVFEEIPNRDVFAFTSLISGLSNNGHSWKSVQLFQRMLDENIEPNGVTFLCVLCACGRVGSVEEGLKIFKSMRSEYKIEPRREHYACVVDLLGRAGLLKEAEKMVREMPMEPDYDVLCALLHACRIHGDVEREKEMVSHLMMERKINCGRFQALLSNIYACSEQWDDVESMRNEMVEMKVRKVPGCSSLVQTDGVVHEFGVGHIAYNLCQ